MDTKTKSNIEQTNEGQKSTQENSSNNNQTNAPNSGKEEFNLDTYRNNLTQTIDTNTGQIEELQEFIKEQNQVVNTLRQEIQDLKKVNLQLATTQSTVDHPQSAEDILTDVFFGKEK